jgi:hypothetical protein
MRRHFSASAENKKPNPFRLKRIMLRKKFSGLESMKNFQLKRKNPLEQHSIKMSMLE